MSLLHRWSLQICFHNQWTCLSLQPCFSSVFSTALHLQSLHLVCCLQLLFMMLFFMMMSLDVVVYEQLDVFVSRQAHIHLIDCIHKRALNSVLVSVILKTIVLVLVRGKWTPTIPGDMETLIASNLSVENQNEHENWLATYLGEWSWRLHNFGREVGRPTAKTAQSTVWAAQRLVDCLKCAMHNLVWLLTAGILQCTFPIRKVCWLRTNLWNFLGQATTVLQKCPKNSWRLVPGRNVQIWRGRRSFLSQIAQCSLGEGRAWAKVGLTRRQETEIK